jgi:hypothetical protein
MHIFGHPGWVSSATIFIFVGDPPLERLDVALEGGVSDRSPGDSFGLEGVDPLDQLGDVDKVGHRKVLVPVALVLGGGGTSTLSGNPSLWFPI